MNVRIFNYADVPSAEFAKAWKETRRIFRRAGVETNWTDCAIPGENAASNPRCIAKTKASDIVIRIIPAVENFKNHSEFGVALIPSGRGFGKYASIFYDRVEGYAERWRTSEGLLLGHLIAHEMGHLLLGAGSHSRSGIMNVPWNRVKIERACLGTLLFTAAEAARMRRQVARRIADDLSR